MWRAPLAPSGCGPTDDAPAPRNIQLRPTRHVIWAPLLQREQCWGYAALVRWTACTAGGLKTRRRIARCPIHAKSVCFHLNLANETVVRYCLYWTTDASNPPYCAITSQMEKVRKTIWMIAYKSACHYFYFGRWVSTQHIIFILELGIVV